MLLNRFSKLAKRLGYTINPLACKINFRFQRRPDIQAVNYHGDFVMVIPKIMLASRSIRHTDLGGRIHPDYFTCEQLLYEKTFSSKNDYGKV